MIIGREKTTKVEEMQANHPFFIIFTSIARHLASIATSLRQVAVFRHGGIGILRQPHALLPEGGAGALHVGRTASEICVLPRRVKHQGQWWEDLGEISYLWWKKHMVSWRFSRLIQ